MKIRRIIIYDRKRVRYSLLLAEAKKHIKKYPIFIGTPRQWNSFIMDIQKSNLNKKEAEE